MPVFRIGWLLLLLRPRIDEWADERLFLRCIEHAGRPPDQENRDAMPMHYPLTFSPDDRWIISGSLDGTIRYWDRTDGTWLATFAPTSDGRWIVLTGRGFFAGSPDSRALINVVRGLQSVSAAQLGDELYRPDLVEQLLKGDPARRYRGAKLDLDKLLDAALSRNPDGSRR